MAAHDRRAAENTDVRAREPAFPHGAPAWPDWGLRRHTGGRGLRVLVLFSGIHSEFAALAAVGPKIVEVLWVELDPRVARVGEATFAAICRRYGLGDVKHTCVARDVLELTFEKLQRIVVEFGVVDLLVASFPCTGVARVNVNGAGLADARSSGLLFPLVDIIEALGAALKEEGYPMAATLIENVSYAENQPEDWMLTRTLLGEPRVFDSAWLSVAHRVRAFFGTVPQMLPAGAQPPRCRLTLGELLEGSPYAPLPEARYSDAFIRDPARAPLNVQGREMVAFPGFTTTEHTINVRRGDALLLHRASGIAVPPPLDFVEYAMGWAPGDTTDDGEDAPTPEFRRLALGNAVDVRLLGVCCVNCVKIA